MSYSPGRKIVNLKKSRLKLNLEVRKRQAAVKAFNSTVSLMRICMKTGTDTSDALELFRAMKDAVTERDYEEVIFLQKEIFSLLKPKFGEIRQRATTAGAPQAGYGYQEEVPMAQPVYEEGVAGAGTASAAGAGTASAAGAGAAVAGTDEAAPTEGTGDMERWETREVTTTPDTPEERKPEVERFSVEDIFVVYNDGRLIYHASQTIDDTCEEIRDDQIMSSMLVAIQHFIRDSMGKGGELGSFEYGENKIMMEQGRFVFLAVVLAGKEPPGLRDEMANIVRRFEGLYAGVVEDWDGDTCIFEDAEDITEPLKRFHEGFIFKEKEKEEIRVMSALEFYQGYIRLKLAVKNKAETLISDASLKLTYNRKALYLSHVEPDYPLEGSTVELGVVQPGEKKTVAFYLDPLICMESYIDGTLIYRDYRGNLKTNIMKRRPADIVCPLFYTDSNINTAMLKRLIEEVKYSDTRRYEIPEQVGPDKAFELVKQAVQRHHVRFVREFKEEDPFVGEAWYYGKIHQVGEEMIIRVTVREEPGVLEGFVASGNLATLTGLLAELGNDLKSLLGEHLPGKEKDVRRLDDSEVVKEIERSNLLIDKYLEGEAPTDEGEIDGSPGDPEEGGATGRKEIKEGEDRKEEKEDGETSSLDDLLKEI